MENINKRANNSIEKFCNKTNVISMDGCGANMLIDLLENQLKKQNQDYINVYIDKINNIALNHPYDTQGVLIETRRVLNSIEESNDIISTLNFQIAAKEILKEFCCDFLSAINYRASCF